MTTMRASTPRKPATPAKPSRKVTPRSVGAPAQAAVDGEKPAAPVEDDARTPRGSAPWATRHAAKRAAEAAARNAAPPPPGSARATLRTPEGAEELKARLGELAGIVSRVRALKKTLPRDFWEIAELLSGCSERRLFEAKGYATFEAFAERELELGKATATRLARIPRTFQATAAELGYSALLAGLEAIDNERDSAARVVAAAPPKPLRPPAAMRG